ncbi:MAG: FAD-dependent oxidoreductase [Bacteroidetes bacterium]|nr:FAD-dependent oxidoreductase [Bacteroidota bacterium]
MKRCVVAGGGLAGLAAALRLSHSPDISVTLCETTPALGGRARSFVDRQSGLEIDNGQHVLMGCYRATLQYLAEAGESAPALRRLRGLALPFLHSDGRRCSLQAGGLPHPFSLVQAFLRYGMLPFLGRLRILRVALRLRGLGNTELNRLDDISAADWLRSCGQGSEEIEYFWRPVILATMNTEAQLASAKLLAAVLREIFLGAPDAADMLLPETGLSPLLIEPTRRTLESRGVRILTGSAVTGITVHGDHSTTALSGSDTNALSGSDTNALSGTGGHVTGVQCGESVFEADAVVLAVPPWAVTRLLPGFDTGMYTPSEILSIHVWTSRDLGRAPMTGLLGTTLQWVFFKGETASGVYHYSCTISAACGDETADEAALRAMLLRELRLLDGELRDEDLIRILPVREKRATFVPRPGLEAQRPSSRTAVAGLFLAGDWTDTGLPATIEGAIRSGFAAADAVNASGEPMQGSDALPFVSPAS